MVEVKKIIIIISTLWFSGCSGDFDEIFNSYEDVQENRSGNSAYTINSDQLPISNNQMQIYLDSINNLRSQPQDCGVFGIMSSVIALKWDTSLYRAAYEHSQDMANVNYFNHTGSGTLSDWTASEYNLNRGSTIQERANSNGYGGMAGENIAAGQTNLDNALAELLISDEHCKNLMNKDYRTFAMAMIKNDNSEYTTYWTQVFGL